jgi:acyl dehydratase
MSGKARMPRVLAVGDRLESFRRHVTQSKMAEFERVVWDRGHNSHSDPKAAQRDGLTKTIASGQNQMAFLHELMEQNFGDAWVYGGKISARWIYPVYSEDLISPHGVVTEVAEIDGKPRVTVQIWCENQSGQKTAAGTASAGQPLASRSWLDANGGSAL